MYNLLMNNQTKNRDNMHRCPRCKQLWEDPEPDDETARNGYQCQNPNCVPSFIQDPYEPPNN